MDSLAKKKSCAKSYSSHKLKKSKKKHKKYFRESSSSDSSSSDDSISSEDHNRHKKSKRKRQRSESSSSCSDQKRKRHKKHKKKKSKAKKMKTSYVHKDETKAEEKLVKSTDEEIGPSLLEARKKTAPMTKEEWEKQQSTVRRVFDPETGRNRLIKGDGEILEEIVSKERHKEINKAATLQDGEYFKKKMGLH